MKNVLDVTNVFVCVVHWGQWFLGEDVFIRQCEGEKHMYHYLMSNQDKIKRQETPYLFIDALNCAQGCLYGTGTEHDKNITDDPLMEIMRIKKDSKNQKAKDTWSRKLSPEKRLKLLNKSFSNLKLEDYLCEYEDRSHLCTHKIPNQAELEQIYQDMGKEDKASRTINCSCCGYDTCEMMATAIFNGYNHKDNCIYRS